MVSVELTIDELLLSILALFPENETVLTTSRPKIHKALFELSNKPNSLLSDIPFDRSYSPYSEHIEQAFYNLEMSSLISAFNPDLKIYEIKQELREYFRENIEKELSSEQLKEIKKISEEFKAKIS